MAAASKRHSSGGLVAKAMAGSSVAKTRRQQAAAGIGKLKIVYCPVYCRTGKCERRGKGCPFK